MSKERRQAAIRTVTLLLGIVFIVAKLAGWITWSWWWVTLPLWLAAAVAVIGLLLIFVAYAAKSSAEDLLLALSGKKTR